VLHIVLKGTLARNFFTQVFFMSLFCSIWGGDFGAKKISTFFRTRGIGRIYREFPVEGYGEDSRFPQ
jgi:hypothetical protein